MDVAALDPPVPGARLSWSMGDGSVPEAMPSPADLVADGLLRADHAIDRVLSNLDDAAHG